MPGNPQLRRDFKDSAAKYFSGDIPTFATVLLSCLLKTYGLDVLKWDGLTIQLQVKDDFGVEMPRLVYDKLMALISAITTTHIYEDVPLFDETVSALCGRGFGEEEDIPAVEDVAWTIAELQLNDPEPVGRHKDVPYGHDIRKYVEVVLADEGFSIAPRILGFAKTSNVKAEGTGDTEMFAAAWGEKQAKADEIDKWVEDKVVILVQQLQTLGISLQDSSNSSETDNKLLDL
jgi:hypothetical protein